MLKPINDDAETRTVSDDDSVACHGESHRRQHTKSKQQKSSHRQPADDIHTKMIQCGACFRSFQTQAQSEHKTRKLTDSLPNRCDRKTVGQHSRICREGHAVVRHFVKREEYKYVFLEKQCKQKLEVKSRFLVNIPPNENWKKLSRKVGLYDSAIKKLLRSKDIVNVDVAVRQRRASGLIIANFMVKNLPPNTEAIHEAKISIQKAADCVYLQLPPDIEMKLHLCKSQECKQLVIRDTEGYCSRHRAQKYHKKVQLCLNQDQQVQNKRTEPQKDSDIANEKEPNKRKQGEVLDFRELSPLSLPPQVVTHSSLECSVLPNNEKYAARSKHVKATAPPQENEHIAEATSVTNSSESTDTFKPSLEQTDNVNDIDITMGKPEAISQDEEMVAEILMNLRSNLMNHANMNNNTNTNSSNKPFALSLPNLDEAETRSNSPSTNSLSIVSPRDRMNDVEQHEEAVDDDHDDEDDGKPPTKKRKIDENAQSAANDISLNFNLRNLQAQTMANLDMNTNAAPFEAPNRFNPAMNAAPIMAIPPPHGQLNGVQAYQPQIVMVPVAMNAMPYIPIPMQAGMPYAFVPTIPLMPTPIQGLQYQPNQGQNHNHNVNVNANSNSNHNFHAVRDHGGANDVSSLKELVQSLFPQFCKTQSQRNVVQNGNNNNNTGNNSNSSLLADLPPLPQFLRIPPGAEQAKVSQANDDNHSQSTANSTTP